MELHLRLIGLILILLALIHAIFPTYFDWANELGSISLINRQMVYVHTFFIALMVMLMGVLCFTSATEIVGTPLGRNLALGLGVFWVCRLGIQLFGYSSTLWKGRRFETIVHILFSALWTYISVVFLVIYLLGKND